MSLFAKVWHDTVGVTYTLIKQSSRQVDWPTVYKNAIDFPGLIFSIALHMLQSIDMCHCL